MYDIAFLHHVAGCGIGLLIRVASQLLIDLPRDINSQTFGYFRYNSAAAWHVTAASGHNANVLPFTLWH